jgi:methionine synthase I (cobalamin-dependent)/5,10-methylenetetrahydrofolate reductase
MSVLSRKAQFLREIKDHVVVADGAMGTMLYQQGFPAKSCFDELNLSHPDTVLKIHQSYLDAGARILETNTFGANPIRLSDFGFQDKAEAINKAAVQLARKVIDDQGWVAGSVGPLNKPLEPIGPLTLDDARNAFRIQITALVEGGVDLIILETFSNLHEIATALEEVRKCSDVPVIALMTFAEDGKTIMGDKPKEVVAELERLGADVIGANCSVGPQGILEVIETIAERTKLPLAAMPNAGFPHMEGGRYIYLTSSSYFADYAKKFMEAGVNIVGGCCGTTPAHIKAIADAVTGKSPGKRGWKATITVESIEEVSAPIRRETVPSRFRDMLNRQFLVSVEIDPPRSVDPGKALEGARILSNAGVHVINVADSPLGRARMSALALAHLIFDRTGMETILHLTCRDRNVLGLQSELLGAHALGVHHIMAITGDPPSAGDYPFSRGVFELDSVGLVHLIRRLNEGRDLSGKDLGEPTNFTIGVGVNPNAVSKSAEIDKLRRKVNAGAHFAFTQPLFQPEILMEFMESIRDIAIPVFVGILPLRNAKHAEFLHNEIPEMIVPSNIRERMHRAGDKGLEEGIAIAREFMEQASKYVQGVYIMPPFNRFQMAANVIKGLVPTICVPKEHALI